MQNNSQNHNEKKRETPVKEMENFLAQNTPRKMSMVFATILRSHCFSVTKRFDLFFIIFTAILYAISIGYIVLFQQTFIRSIYFLMLQIILIPVAFYFLCILLPYVRRLSILVYGKSYRASIINIEKAYINYSSIPVYRLKLKLEIKGSDKICYSYVREEAIDQFYDVVDSGKENNIEVLYKGSKEVMVPSYLIYMAPIIRNDRLYYY